MGNVRVVEIKEDIKSRNNEGADRLRRELIEKKVFYVNVMSSPGSGKTTLITSLVERLKQKYAVGIIEADIDSDVDAAYIAQKTGVKTIQIHTSGACHLTCQMSEEALNALGVDGLDVVILENIGNLVCPAEFDTGASCNLVLLSTPEGDDKPLKYPLMFEVASLVAVTKADVAHVFNFSFDRAVKNISYRNPNAPVFITSAKDGSGIEELSDFLCAGIEKCKNRND